VEDTMSTDVTDGPVGVEQGAVADPDDPREHIEVGVLMANGRLVGRRFASRAEAEAWARPDEGEQVVEYNLVCDCSM
jgi:hypothetical protein